MTATAKIKPVIKLDFTDFGCINKVDNWFTQILRRDFTVIICDQPDLLIFQEGGHLNRLYTCKKLFLPMHLIPHSEFLFGCQSGLSAPLKAPGEAIIRKSRGSRCHHRQDQQLLARKARLGE